MPARSDAPDMVKVWDWPLRAFHWALAFFVLLAWFTPSKFDNLHRFAGYTVIVLIAFRIGWGVFGTRFSRFHAIGRRLRAAPAYLSICIAARPGAIAASIPPALRCW
jgi:cytochrome b